MRISDWSSDVCLSDLGMGPGQERDAIARVMQVDPEAGMKMFKDWQDRNLTADSISQRRESDQITAQNHALSNTEKGIKLLGMAAGATTPETWDQKIGRAHV